MLQIVTAPDPRLAQPSRLVREDEFGPELDRHMDEMVVTMQAAAGAGLAGVQVGDMRRLLVVCLGPDRVPEKVVNPEVVKASKLRHRDREGCLSFPARYREVNRPRQITVCYRTPLGETREVTLTGFDSRCFQHEVDHLDGRTIL